MESIVSGKLPEGCEICRKGAKAVLFITGKCESNCYYCPISHKRDGSERIWINEREVECFQDIYTEIDNLKALGTSITGGEPLNTFDKVLKSIHNLKDEYGESHHIHLYTSKAVEEERLMSLDSAGLDEIRYHIKNLEISDSYLNSIKKSSSMFDTGIEIPSIPGRLDDILDILEEAYPYLDFINLNEFEHSETNFDELSKRGFRGHSSKGYAIDGSKEVAEKVIEKWEKCEINLHFCPSNFKDSVQLRKRLQRTANNIKEPYHKVTDDGTLVKAEIKYSDLEELKSLLTEDIGIPPKMLYVDKDRDIIETAVWILREYIQELYEIGAIADIVEFYPTYDKIEVQRIPI